MQRANWLSGVLECLIEALCLLQGPIEESLREAPSLFSSTLASDSGRETYHLLGNCSTDTEGFGDFVRAQFSGMNFPQQSSGIVILSDVQLFLGQ